jgi:phosphoglycolate phosphatase-like HAD superfamily hydrolase
MRYKLAVFDWNGTLIDDAEACLIATNAVLAQAGVPSISLERYLDTLDFPIIHLYSRNGITVDDYLANFQEYGLVWTDTYEEASKTSPLRRGTTDLLSWLQDQGVILMILSNYTQYELEAQISERHVFQYFKHISGNVDFNKQDHTRTTKSGRLKAIMDEFGYRPEEAFIVGDSMEEPEVAKELGLTCFSVTWGSVSAERLCKSPTHHMVEELAEIKEILQR